jgi:hypothetical protein
LYFSIAPWVKKVTALPAGGILFRHFGNAVPLRLMLTNNQTIMKMKKIMSGVTLFNLLIVFSCTSRQTIDQRFNGTYRLDKFESFDTLSGKWITDKWRGKYADGFIQYDGKGHMSVHLFPKDYKDFDTKKNIDSISQETLKDLVKFYQSNFVYFANYKILNDSTIEHHRISATEPKNFGTILTRNFEFRKDTLILTAVEKIEGKKMRLRWVKL